jgi:hypothetical protein
VAAEVASALPFLLNAVTATRSVEPASLEAIRCVDAVWPGIDAQAALSQRSH